MTTKRWVVWGLLVILIMVGTGCSAGEPARLVAEMDDRSFSLTEDWSTHAGDPVTITLVNNGMLKHEIAILDAGYTLLTKDAAWSQEVRTDPLRRGRSGEDPPLTGQVLRNPLRVTRLDVRGLSPPE